MIKINYDRPRFVLIRGPYLETCTKSRLLIMQAASVLMECAVIELPWKNNAPRISCIPTGVYQANFTQSPRFGTRLWEIVKVPGRSGIRIHVANMASQLEGCLAPGDMHVDLNRDGVPDVRNSRRTLDRIHATMGEVTSTTIEIYGQP